MFTFLVICRFLNRVISSLSPKPIAVAYSGCRASSVLGRPKTPYASFERMNGSGIGYCPEVAADRPTTASNDGLRVVARIVEKSPEFIVRPFTCRAQKPARRIRREAKEATA